VGSGCVQFGNARSSARSIVTSLELSFIAKAMNSQSYAEHALSRASARTLSDSFSYSAPSSKLSASL